MKSNMCKVVMDFGGMELFLKEMISDLESAKKDEQERFPDRDVKYLDKLIEDFTITLHNYEGRNDEGV